MSPEKNEESPHSIALDSPIRIGDVLANRFEIRKELGLGSVGICFAAYDRNREQDICLKVIHPILLKDPKAEALFLEAAKVACDLRHPEIVNVYDIHRETGLLFLSMELLKGKTLCQEMEERKASGRVFELAEVKVLAESMGRALEYAHRITLHRSLKPEAVWILEMGSYKITEFALAHCLTRRQTTMTTVASGTAYYLPPELIDEEKEMDVRGDQYALAVVLYEVLTGELPLGIPKPASALRSEIYPRVSVVLAKALAPDPDRRYPSIREFMHDLAISLQPSFFRRHARLTFVAAAIAVFAGIGSTALLTDNAVSRWTQETVSSWSGPNWELRAEEARDAAMVASAGFFSDCLSLFAAAEELGRKTDSERVLFTSALGTNRFSGPLDRFAKDSVWSDLRPRLIKMLYGLQITNTPLPDFLIDTIPRKVQEHVAGLLVQQESHWRSLQILNRHVLNADSLIEANSTIGRAQNRFDEGRFHEALKAFQAAAEKYRLLRAKVTEANLTATALQTALNRKIEYLSLGRLSGATESSGALDTAARLDKALETLTAGDMALARSEFEASSQGWSGLSEEIVDSLRKAAIRSREDWLGLFANQEAPRLEHLGNPNRAIQDAGAAINARVWFEAYAKLDEARLLYLSWTKDGRISE